MPDRTAEQQEAQSPFVAAYPYCPGHATTWIKVVANLDASDPVPMLDWDLQDPTNTSNFSTSMTIADALGRPLCLDVFFRKTGYNRYDYHALPEAKWMNGELGTGELLFRSDGALLSWVEFIPLRLPNGQGGFGPVIALNFGHSLSSGGDGLDGVTQWDRPESVSAQSNDSAAREVGEFCPEVATSTADAPPQPDQRFPPASMPDANAFGWCATRATSRLFFIGNLHASTTPLAVRWDPFEAIATSNFGVESGAVDASSYGSAFDVYFRNEGVRLWSYHVLLHSTRSGVELASGELTFDELGRLVEHLPLQSLQYPAPDGFSGAPLVLDFGPSLVDGGNGVDGLTSTASASSIAERIDDGQLGDPVRDCSEVPSPLQQTHFDYYATHYCDGLRTTQLILNGSLLESTPVMTTAWDPMAPGPTSSVSTLATAIDVLGDEHTLLVALRKLDASAWELRLLDETARCQAELLAAVLHFDGTQGKLLRVAGPDSFRLTPSRDLAGTLIQLDYGVEPLNGWPNYPWSVASACCQGANFLSARVDGQAPIHTANCVR